MNKTQSFTMHKPLMIVIGSHAHKIRCCLALGVAFLMTAGNASADIVGWAEDFSGPAGPLSNLNSGAPWTEVDDTSGWALNGSGQYNTKDTDSTQGKLRRSVVDTPGVQSYTNYIELDLIDFSGGNVFWKSFGSGGFQEVVVEGNGNIRMFTNVGGGGNLFITNVGQTTGDSLALRQIFDAGAGTMTVDYNLNGGGFVNLYSGLGNGGTAFTDVINNFVDLQVGNGTGLDINVDQWNLTPVPEPGSFAVATSGLLLLGLRRRRRKSQA